MSIINKWWNSPCWLFSSLESSLSSSTMTNAPRPNRLNVLMISELPTLLARRLLSPEEVTWLPIWPVLSITIPWNLDAGHASAKSLSSITWRSRDAEMWWLLVYVIENIYDREMEYSLLVGSVKLWHRGVIWGNRKMDHLLLMYQRIKLTSCNHNMLKLLLEQTTLFIDDSIDALQCLRFYQH